MTDTLARSTVDSGFLSMRAAYLAARRGAERGPAVEKAVSCDACADLWHAVSILLYADEPGLALELCLRFEERTRGRAVLGLLRARIAHADGKPLVARELARSVLAERALPVRTRHLALAELVTAEVAVEQYGTATALLRDHGLDGEVPDVPEAPHLLAARGALHVASGRRRPGVEDLLDCGRRLLGDGVRNPAVIPWRSRAALAALGDRRQDLARVLAGQELIEARTWGTSRAVGIALHAVASTRDGDEAVEMLGESVDLLSLSTARQELLRAREDLAQIVRAGRDLTRQEAKIAWLARSGYSNKQISEQLFLTRRTIEFHLSGVYRKLGLSGRHELRVALPDQFGDQSV
jgi:DNA-binding CsgD family transcriptional regulator